MRRHPCPGRPSRGCPHRANPDAALVADIGIPDCAGRIEANPIGMISRRRGAYPTLVERSVPGDLVGRQLLGVGLRHDQGGPSAVKAIPFGKASPSATGLTLPSGVTSTMMPGVNSPPGKSNPMLLT